MMPASNVALEMGCHEVPPVPCMARCPQVPFVKYVASPPVIASQSAVRDTASLWGMILAS